MNTAIIWATRFVYVQMHPPTLSRLFPFYQIFNVHIQSRDQLIAISVYSVAVIYLVVRLPIELLFFLLFAMSTGTEDDNEI